MDYLEIYKKFKDVKEIADYIDEVEKLRYYYDKCMYNDMQLHISNLMFKYPLETFVWNSVNCDMPTTYQQSYINAENFLAAYGAKLIIEKANDYKSRLLKEEISYVEMADQYLK